MWPDIRLSCAVIAVLISCGKEGSFVFRTLSSQLENSVVVTVAFPWCFSRCEKHKSGLIQAIHILFPNFKLKKWFAVWLRNDNEHEAKPQTTTTHTYKHKQISIAWKRTCFAIMVELYRFVDCCPHWCSYLSIHRTEGALAAISMISSFLIIITYLLMKSLRRFPTNLVFYLSVCDFVFSLKFFVTRWSLAQQRLDAASHDNTDVLTMLLLQCLVSLTTSRNPISSVHSTGCYHAVLWPWLGFLEWYVFVCLWV